MMIGLDRYKKSWLTLEDAYDNNFTKHEEKDRHILSRILRMNGWNEDEIEWFDHYNDRLGTTLDYAYEFLIPNVLRERFEQF